MRWVLLPYRRYFEFRGRSRRTEFWAFFLGCLIIVTVFRLIENLAPPLPGLDLPGPLFALGSFIPGLAVTVRRLHDANRTGWWALLPFTAFLIALAAFPFGVELHDAIAFLIAVTGMLCPVALLVLLAWKGTSAPNRFGEDPRHRDADLETVFS